MSNQLPLYNEFSKDFLWPVTVKYKGQPAVDFSVSKSVLLNAIQSIESETEETILIGSRYLKRRNLEFISFEGRAYQFSD